MADRERERAARIARMAATPVKPQFLAELDLEITDAIRLAIAGEFQVLLRLLLTAKAEVVELRGRPVAPNRLVPLYAIAAFRASVSTGLSDPSEGSFRCGLSYERRTAL
jgi:hypothetical protein